MYKKATIVYKILAAVLIPLLLIPVTLAGCKASDNQFPVETRPFTDSAGRTADIPKEMLSFVP